MIWADKPQVSIIDNEDSSTKYVGGEGNVSHWDVRYQLALKACRPAAMADLDATSKAGRHKPCAPRGGPPASNTGRHVDGFGACRCCHEFMEERNRRSFKGQREKPWSQHGARSGGSVGRLVLGWKKKKKKTKLGNRRRKGILPMGGGVFYHEIVHWWASTDGHVVLLPEPVDVVRHCLASLGWCKLLSMSLEFCTDVMDLAKI